MGQFLHPNVVKLYGVVTVGEPVSVYVGGKGWERTEAVNHNCVLLCLHFVCFPKEVHCYIQSQFMYFLWNYFCLQVMICLEIMSNGDLRNYLRSIDMARYESQICMTLKLYFTVSLEGRI